MSRNIELIKIKEALLQRLGEMGSFERGIGLSDVESADFLDQAARTAAAEVGAAISAHDAAEAYQIGRALDAIEKGTYGICDICGKSIPVGRLEALPYCTTCVKCKEGVEKGDSSMIARESFEINSYDLPPSVEDSRDNHDTQRTMKE